MICLFLSSLVSYSQIRESGVIQGQVNDREGNILPGAAVTIEGSKLIGGPRTAVTDKKGFFKFNNLPYLDALLKIFLKTYPLSVLDGCAPSEIAKESALK